MVAHTFAWVDSVGVDVVGITKDNFALDLLREAGEDLGQALLLRGRGRRCVLGSSAFLLRLGNDALGVGNELV